MIFSIDIKIFCLIDVLFVSLNVFSVLLLNMTFSEVILPLSITNDRRKLLNSPYNFYEEQ